MRMTFLFFIIFSLPYLISAQFTDNFSDGDFTNNPTWFGDSNKFEVDSSGRLHTIYDSVSSEIYLSTISKGILLKVIVNNELLGSSGTKIWNGTDDNSSLLPQGIYIVLIEVLSDDGYINQYKKVVVLQN